METACQKLINFLKEQGENYIIEKVMPEKIPTDFKSAMAIPTSMEEVEELLQSKNPTLYEGYSLFKNFVDMLESLENNSGTKAVLKSTDFSNLSTALAMSPLKNRERVECMLELLEKNINCIEEYNQLVEIHNYFAELHNKVVEENAKRKPSITNFFLKAKKDTSKNIELIEEDDFTEMWKFNQILREHYFDKLDSYDMNDIEIFINVLVEMELEPSICEGTKSLMLKNFEKRNKQVISYVTPSKTENLTEKVIKLTQKESKMIYHEIKTLYFDLENMKSIRYLSAPEKIRVVTLLKQLNYKVENIQQILSLIDTENKKYNDTIDPVIEYADIMYQAAYYENQLALEQYSQNIEEYLDEWLAANESDCSFWEDVLKEEFDKVKSILPTTHEYEFEKASKILELK